MRVTFRVPQDTIGWVRIATLAILRQIPCKARGGHRPRACRSFHEAALPTSSLSFLKGIEMKNLVWSLSLSKGTERSLLSAAHFAQRRGGEDSVPFLPFDKLRDQAIKN